MDPAWDGSEPVGSGEVPFVLHLVDDTEGTPQPGRRRRRREITVDHIAGQSPREVSGDGASERGKLRDESRERTERRIWSSDRDGLTFDSAIMMSGNFRNSDNIYIYRVVLLNNRLSKQIVVRIVIFHELNVSINPSPG